MNKPVAWMVDGVLFTSLGAALNISFDIKRAMYRMARKVESILNE